MPKQIIDDKTEKEMRIVRAKIREENLRSLLNSDTISFKNNPSNKDKYKGYSLKFDR